MRRSFLICIGLAALSACIEIVSPPPPDGYEYRRFEPDGAGGQRALAFHWPRELLPVKVWVDNGDALRPAVVKALATWEATFLFGEFRAELVGSADEADIIVRNEVAPFKPVGATRLASVADECRGETTFVADAVAGTLTLPFEVYTWPRFGPDVEGLALCYELTVLHEIGHALGIFAHSPVSDDLMYGDPERSDLSDRDRATANTAYHRPTTLTPVPR